MINERKELKQALEENGLHGASEEVGKQIEDYLKRNIKILTEKVEEFPTDNGYFGAAFIQRHCRVGYNQACDTIQYGVNEGIIVRNPNNGYQYKFKP